MIPADAPFAAGVVGLVLAGMLTVLIVRAVRRDRREYARFKRYRGTLRRQRMLKKWLVQSFAWLGGSTLVLLALVWQFIGPFLDDVEAWPLMQSFREAMASEGPLRSLVVGGTIGAAAVILLSVLFVRHEGEIPALGDIHALLPRNRAELRYAWGLSINAGVLEELLFRLALPVAIFAVTRSALVAVALSLVVFAGLHVYQGWLGVLGILVFGTLLMALFLLTGSIVWPILAHTLFDLRSLVLIPMRVKRVHRVGT